MLDDPVADRPEPAASPLVRLLAAARGRFALAASASGRPGRWLALFRILTLPLLAWGALRHYRASSGGAQLALACVGHERRFVELLAALFGRIEPRARGGLRGAWRERALARIPASAVLVDLHGWFVARFRRAGWLIVPETVCWRGELSALPSPNPSKGLRNDQRKLLSHADELEEGRTSEDWDELFARMVIPYARSRFESWARLPTRHELLQLRRRGRVLFVRRGEVRVSGCCVRAAGTSLQLQRLGVRDADRRLLREGALSSLYLLLIEWARAQGLRSLDAGPTLPLPDHGAARYKAKLGLSPHPDPQALTLGLRFDHRGPVAEALRRRQIFHLVEDRVEVFASERGAGA